MDFDALRQELSDHVIEGPKERYQFTWPDKAKARVLANTPTTMTLRPCREESVDFDNTKNLYIEGDNLEVLKILRETYLGKVKMIYIDPPYNTGNDFVYDDDFSMSTEEYHKIDGNYSIDNERLFLNSITNGRFHTDWLNMIYPRLSLAKDFLTDDGVIFISIDDNEIDNLIKVCNEIFGEHNHICNIIWERAFSPKNDSKFVSSSHDFIIMYAKNANSFIIGKLPRTDEANARYKNPDNDPRGPWAADNMTVKSYAESYDYAITTPSGKQIKPTNGRCWFTSKERMDELIKDGRVWFGEDGSNTPRIKRFLSEVQQGMTPTTIWKYDEVGHSQEGRQELKKLFNGIGIFDGPKPIRLMKRLLKIANLKNNSIVLDFFSGSATTAQAIMEYNHDCNSHVEFVMVQMNELIDSNQSDSSIHTICDIGKERIRRSGSIISEIDNGFRVFKTDSSNMNDVFYSPDELKHQSLDNYGDNIKPDRTPEDLLIQVMLELGIELSASISEETVEGRQIFNVDDGYLIASLSDTTTEQMATEIAKQKRPVFAIIRNGPGMTDEALANIEQIFKTYSPQTTIRML